MWPSNGSKPARTRRRSRRTWETCWATATATAKVAVVAPAALPAIAGCTICDRETREIRERAGCSSVTWMFLGVPGRPTDSDANQDALFIQDAQRASLSRRSFCEYDCHRAGRG